MWPIRERLNEREIEKNEEHKIIKRRTRIINEWNKDYKSKVKINWIEWMDKEQNENVVQNTENTIKIEGEVWKKNKT